MRVTILLFMLLTPFSSFSEVTNNEGVTAGTGASIPMSRLASACTAFISSSGAMGPWGEALISAFERVGTDCMYEQANWSAICPGFTNMSNAQKRQLIVYAFAAVADAESTCRPSAQAQGTTDLAVGLFQLENSWRQRNDADRHELCSPNAPVAEPKAISFQMQCAAGTFYDYHCNRSDDRYTRVGNGGYWQKWRRPNRAISRDISHFPGCN